jgi:hypothetical protein
MEPVTLAYNVASGTGIKRGESILPTLEWIGKDKVVNHHQDVPYRVLEHKYTYMGGGANGDEQPDGNKIIKGDNRSVAAPLFCSIPRWFGSPDSDVSTHALINLIAMQRLPRTLHSRQSLPQ